MSRISRAAFTAIAAGCAFIPGCWVGIWINIANETQRDVEYLPLPHHIPKAKGAATFRFAMAHDVIHERYPKHGPTYYSERERLARARLEQIKPDSEEAFDLTDDLATALDKLGRSEEAVAILRKKLELQKARSFSGRDLYTTYANLGTSLVHARLPRAMTGDKEAKSSVQEGLEFISDAIRVNMDAHYGRENWQLNFGRFLLEVCNDQNVLCLRDCVKNEVVLSWADIRARRGNADHNSGDEFGRAFVHSDFFHVWPTWPRKMADAWQRIGKDVDRFPDVEDEVRDLRSAVATVGSDAKWDYYGAATKPPGVPFDEPMLAIVGMWRQGEGANAHFSLAIGETMLRVGQRRLAWTAYERTVHLAEGFSPKPELQKWLRDHCRKRQREIEDTFPADAVVNFRPDFNAELAFGQRYQREYQDYEVRKISDGANVNDEHFYDEFHAGREPIASPSGPEEWYALTRVNYGRPFQIALAGGCFGAALGALLISIVLYSRQCSRSK